MVRKIEPRDGTGSGRRQLEGFRENVVVVAHGAVVVFARFNREEGPSLFFKTLFDRIVGRPDFRIIFGRAKTIVRMRADEMHDDEVLGRGIGERFAKRPDHLFVERHRGAAAQFVEKEASVGERRELLTDRYVFLIADPGDAVARRAKERQE